MLTTLGFLVIVFIIFPIFFAFQNFWVYRQRMKVLNDESLPLNRRLIEYGKLAEYDAMLWRWWIWDIEKFKK